MFRRDDPNNSDGIFVLDGQIFSVNDLISTMRRMGISIRLSRDGLTIDGEHISSITNLDGNKCPLASNCDKRIALVEFLKLQKRQSVADNQQQQYSNRSSEYDQEPMYSSPSRQHSRDEYHSEESSRDFIKPNNHDLFEGNIANSSPLFDEPQEETRGLFDEPEFQSKPEERLFEDSFFSRSESNFSRDKQHDSRGFQEDRNQRNMGQLYCKKCGYDLDSGWSICPKCGSRVPISTNNRSEPEYLF